MRPAGLALAGTDVDEIEGRGVRDEIGNDRAKDPFVDRLIIACAPGRLFGHVVFVKQHVCCRVDTIFVVEDLIVGLDLLHHALDLAVNAPPLDCMLQFMPGCPKHMPTTPLVVVWPVQPSGPNFR